MFFLWGKVPRKTNPEEIKMKRSWFSILALLLVASLVLAACGPTPAPTQAPAPTAVPETGEVVEEPPAVMPDVGFAVIPGGYLERALAGEFSGTTVIVDGPFTDADEIKFRESYKDFEELTGIRINYIGNKEFEASIGIRVDAGNEPDIADFPQPGLLATFARQGKVVDPSTFIPMDWLRQQWNESWLQMAMVPGPDGNDMMGGLWYRFNGKSLVWYPKDNFDTAGYQIPTTWDEMLALSDEILADGDAPWCVGIESGVATGWPATDWMEEIMLRTTSLENYDRWVEGTLPFSSPEVKNAAETLGQLWFKDGYVFGGRNAIVSTFFGDAPSPMFEDPPKCWLHKQGNFITGFFPDGTQAGVDYDFFYLPPIDPAYGKPFLVAGDIMAMFHDRPEVRALMEFFTVPQSAKGWLETGGALATHKTATPDMYGVPLERGIAELVTQATSFRFDASDLMPGEVGAGSFWKGMTDWVSGAATLDTVLAEIDESWPEGARGQVGPAVVEGMPFPVLPGGYLERALAGEFSGTTVIVDGPFTDADEIKFRESYKDFEELTGIRINYIGNKEFEASIGIRVDAGNEPDIADFPQPGLLATFTRQGKVVDPSTFIPMDWLRQQWNESWLQMAMVPGPDGNDMMGGLWYRFNGKSLVWYPKDNFDAAGYQIPTTWDEMLALSDEILADGDAPWCVGIESGVATGWPATDWMEEIMLRTTSLENYDRWVEGTLPFSSPEVKNAAETLGQLWFTDGYVFGGRNAIVSTFFGDAPSPMFEDPPKCWLHKQGNFITGFFPDGTQAGVDYDFFYLPPIDPAYGKPFLVAGDIVAMFHDRPEVRALMEFFTVPQSAKGWLETGGALATHKTATPDMYGVPLERGIAELVTQATSFRFDASDLMPGEVGAGSFWKGMTDWVSGAATLDTVLAEIDESWPR
jgi:alpha-glucoside transport system substrate-binding protein